MRRTRRWVAAMTVGITFVGAVGGTAVAARTHRHGGNRATHRSQRGPVHSAGHGGALPVAAMQSALHAKGTVTNGVLSVSLDRDDIGTVRLHGTPIKPSFQLNSELDFQPIGRHRALFNGDLALKADEINPVIDSITSHGLTFQAEHQHMYDFDPIVWFIHLRGKGDPVTLARDVHAVVTATSTPLPQQPPSNPKTPLDTARLRQILHGYDAEVSSDGVVTVHIARRNQETLAGVPVKPQTNIATNVAFEPLSSGGSHTAVVADFGLTAPEVDPVIATMRAQGWDIGCLYNQETGEFPQLFFSHEFKAGDPYELAAETRKGLDRANYK